ncbi:MAG: glycosyltransferase family 39 protein [Isosphaeraceae bacterium]|nr:glycosyltransferase family 39 protein [Isosphaeraceae bacterium]
MSADRPRLRAIDRAASLTLVLEWALGLRVLAADVVQWLTERKGKLCLFPDADIYWHLARTIRQGEPFEVVLWGDLPHFALRTPGYPLFLALCQAVCGESPLAVRLVQAVIGAASVWLVFRLTRTLAAADRGLAGPWSTPLVAAALAAIDPYYVGTAALLLSEAVFIPLIVLSLWGLAVLWGPPSSSRPVATVAWAATVGAASGAAVLVRPSWALCVPALLLAWVAFSGRGHRLRAVRGALIVALAAAVVMAPWWVRNARVFGKFVPTALWMGASLYDGLNPHATGASDMEFVNEPDIWPLGEEAQDAELRRRAVAFARANPGRTAQLAGIKLLRYWSPWPNAETLRSPWVAVAWAMWTLPLYVLWAAGAWDRRRDARALVLLAGPLLYFCGLHMIFAGSMRYRIPGAVPALGLAAIGLRSLIERGTRRAAAEA